MIEIAVPLDLLPTPSAIINSIITEIIVGLLIIGGGSWFYRAKLKAIGLRAAYYLLNSEILLQISRIDKYDDEPVGVLDHDTFSAISDEYSGDVYSPEISDKRIVVSVEDVPSKIVITFDKIFDFTDGNETVQGYKLRIETDRSLRFGYRNYSSLETFKEFSEVASNAVRITHFDGNTPNQSFMLGEMSSGVPSGRENVEDDELQISAHVEGSDMYFVFENPKNLVRGVRKYFQPQLSVIG